MEYELLIQKWLQNELSETERLLLDDWLKASPKNIKLFESLTNTQSLHQKLAVFHEIETNEKERAREKVLQTIVDTRPQKDTRYLAVKWKYWAAAAIFFLFIGLGYNKFYSNYKNSDTVLRPKVERFKNDVPPGSNKALLVLADGTKVPLDSVGQKNIAENGANINIENGMLNYDKVLLKNNNPVYNTLFVPRKGEYKLQLADGTIAMLNSESSIYYPVSFTGKERRVEITGEVYFEVKKDSSKPFIVTANGTEIKVLGTHFNIDAYEKGIVKTTLVEGRVDVSKNNKTVRLKPGQQAISSVSGLSEGYSIYVDEVVAWTKGKFNFQEKDIAYIMSHVERWYDVDVAYDDIPKQLFIAKIPRTVSIATFLDILENTGYVHFKIDGQHITVIK